MKISCMDHEDPFCCDQGNDEGTIELTRIQRDGKFGFIDNVGKMVVPCQWDMIGYFQEGLAQVRYDGKFGYIDETGIEVIPCQWDEIEIQPCSMDIIC